MIGIDQIIPQMGSSITAGKAAVTTHLDNADQFDIRMNDVIVPVLKPLEKPGLKGVPSPYISDRNTLVEAPDITFAGADDTAPEGTDPAITARLNGVAENGGSSAEWARLTQILPTASPENSEKSLSTESTGHASQDGSTPVTEAVRPEKGRDALVNPSLFPDLYSNSTGKAPIAAENHANIGVVPNATPEPVGQSTLPPSPAQPNAPPVDQEIDRQIQQPLTPQTAGRQTDRQDFAGGKAAVTKNLPIMPNNATGAPIGDNSDPDGGQVDANDVSRHLAADSSVRTVSLPAADADQIGKRGQDGTAQKSVPRATLEPTLVTVNGPSAPVVASDLAPETALPLTAQPAQDLKAILQQTMMQRPVPMNSSEGEAAKFPVSGRLTTRDLEGSVRTSPPSVLPPDGLKPSGIGTAVLPVTQASSVMVPEITLNNGAIVPMIAEAPSSSTAASAAANPAAGVNRTLEMASDGQWLAKLSQEIGQLANNKGSINFQLKPAYLGKMLVEIKQGPNGDVVQLGTENEQTKSLIVAAQGRLEQDIRLTGAKLARIDVTADAEPGFTFQQNGAGNNNEQFGNQYPGQGKTGTDIADTISNTGETVPTRPSGQGARYA